MINMWEAYKKGFKSWLQLEKSLSDNSVQAYMSDIQKLTDYLELNDMQNQPGELELNDFNQFLQFVNKIGITETSQARLISGIKSFYKYCIIEDIATTIPTHLLESPKLKRKLPDILSFDEIEKIINSINLSTPEGQRNKAIIETMYSSGLRVSELVNLCSGDAFMAEHLLHLSLIHI